MPEADGEAEETTRLTETGEVPAGSERASASRPSEGSRDINKIDCAEIMAAFRDVFRSGKSLDPETTITEVAHLLGFRRTGKRIREELRGALRTAIRRHLITRENGIITIECATIDDYSRDELIEALLAAMGNTWWVREDAIRAAARRLGFRRTGARITKAFKSAINGALRRRRLEFDRNLIRRTK